MNMHAQKRNVINLRTNSRKLNEWITEWMHNCRCPCCPVKWSILEQTPHTAVIGSSWCHGKFGINRTMAPDGQQANYASTNGACQLVSTRKWMSINIHRFLVISTGGKMYGILILRKYNWQRFPPMTTLIPQSGRQATGDYETSSHIKHHTCRLAYTVRQLLGLHTDRESLNTLKCGAGTALRKPFSLFAQ